MDLSNLLSPERIRCRCQVKSKKRTLQTLAELLGESLRTSSQIAEAENEQSSSTEPVNSTTEKLSNMLKSRDKICSEPEVLTDMGILDALISRERLGSTGLGHGVGLPHSRLCSIEEPIAALVTLESGVDYESADAKPVDLVLGLLVPEHCNDEHLKILAHLAKRFSNSELRDKIRDFNDPQELFKYIASLPTLE